MPGYPIPIDAGSQYPRPITQRTLCNGDPATQLNHGPYHQYCNIQRNYYAQENHGPVEWNLDIREVVRLVQGTLSRAEILAKLKASYAPSNSIDHDAFYENLMDLGARFASMMNIGLLKNQANPKRCLEWTQGTLSGRIAKHFDPVPRLPIQAVNGPHSPTTNGIQFPYSLIQLPKSFDAWSICNISGLEVEFTDNLVDHLYLVDDSKLLVFHQVSFLESQAGSPLYPPGFVQETLNTIALLFPQREFVSIRGSSRKKRWFRALCQKWSRETQGKRIVDERISRCGTLQAEERQILEFKFWRRRLMILKQTYDSSTPSSMSQFWWDRRNGVQWYTFWVAVLVFIVTTVLGIVECTLAGMQLANN